MESVWLGVLFGAVFTAIIQSSSAMLGIIIALSASGAITLHASIPLMMRAEIGTCADTLIASLGRSREAVRAGLFQLFGSSPLIPTPERLPLRTDRAGSGSTSTSMGPLPGFIPFVLVPSLVLFVVFDP